MEIEGEKTIIPIRDRECYDCTGLYKHWGSRYDNLEIDQQNAYWFLKLTAAELSKWTEMANLFEAGQSALEAVVMAVNNLIIRENMDIDYLTTKYRQKPDVEPSNESMKKIKKGPETARLDFWRTCALFYDGWQNIPEFDSILFPCKEMLGATKGGMVQHKYVSLKSLAETIIAQAKKVKMYGINPKKQGEFISLDKEEDRFRALMISVGKLAVESVSIKDLLYTAHTKQGNSRTKDSAWHLPEAMRSKHVKATNFQSHYKTCTSIYRKVKNAKNNEYQQILAVAQRNKANLKQMVFSHAQKCIIDILFTNSGFADRDDLVKLLFFSLYWVMPRKNMEYNIPVVCINLCTEKLPKTYSDHVLFFSKCVNQIRTAFESFVPSLCMLDMLSDTVENINEVFGKEIPSRDEWKRPKMGYKCAEAMTFVVPEEPVLFHAPMKDSPSFVLNEAQSEVCFPAMGKYKKSYDEISNWLVGGNTQLIKAYLSAEIAMNKTMSVKGNIADRWERTSAGWEKKDKDEGMKSLIEDARIRYVISMNEDKRNQCFETFKY